MAGKDLAKITAGYPGEGQQAIQRKCIEVLPAMPRPPGLFRAEAKESRNMEITVQGIEIGIGMMEQVMFLAPQHLAPADHIECKPHEPVHCFVC